MKLLLLVLSMCCTLSVSCQTAPSTNVKPVTAAQAAQLAKSDKQMQILDVRTPEECAGGVIKGAQKINFPAPDFTTKVLEKLDRNKPVLIYCAAGGRSSKASILLEKAGFKQVYNMTEGFGAWKANGDAVE
jgi:phage shock protein E